METEQQLMSRLWKEVQDKSGFLTKAPAKQIDLSSWIFSWGMDPTQAGAGPDGHGGWEFVYSPGISTHLSHEQLKGMMAHELGHIAHKDTGKNPPLEEPNADFFAATHGFGKQLISGIKAASTVLGRRGMSTVDDGHGTDEQRAIKIQNWMKQS